MKRQASSSRRGRKRVIRNKKHRKIIMVLLFIMIAGLLIWLDRGKESKMMIRVAGWF